MIFAMTPEEHMKLDRSLALAEENNAILRGMRRTQRITAIMHILYWVIIIGVSVGAFYFIQPYLTFLTGGLLAPSAHGETGGSELDTLLNALKQAQSSGASLQDLLK